MYKTLSLLILIAWTFSADARSAKKTQEDLPQFTCRLEPQSTLHRCHFFNLNTTIENPYFQPYNGQPETIREVSVNYDQMEILTINICNYFSNLKELYIQPAIKLQGFTEDALKSCSNLEKIQIGSNNLTEIPQELFKNNPKLRHIAITKNPLRKFLPNTFDHLENLLAFEATSTLIEEIPVEDLKGNNNQVRIDAYSNNLKDFPIEKLLEKFPNLRIVNFNDNDIKCTRVQEIFDYVEAYRGVSIFRWSNNKERQEEVDEVNGVICIP